MWREGDMNHLAKGQAQVIAHISNTNVRQDHRVQKAMRYGQEAGYSTMALGFTAGKIGWAAGAHDTGKRHDIQTVKLFVGRKSGRLRRLTLLFQVVEMNLKVLFHLLRARPDALHCHGFTTLPGAVLSKFLLHCSLIYDAHELESARDGLSNLERKLVFFGEKILWPWIDGFVTVSPSIQKWYNSKLGTKPSALVLNSPIFVRRDQISKSRIQPNKHKETFRVGYVGALTAGRSIVEFASVMTSVEGNFLLTFIGEGPLRGELEQISNSDARIEVLHSVSQGELSHIISSFDLGLCLIENTSLSNYFAIPNKLLEYLEMGVPVLASDFPDIRWVLAHGDYGVTADPSDMQILVEKLKVFSAGGALPTPVLEEKFRWPAQLASLGKFYAECLQNNN